MLQSILFTHNDLDGAGCSILFEIANNAMGWKKDKDFIIRNMDNKNISKVVQETINNSDCDAHTEIFFADLCCDTELMSELVKKFELITIYDHHRSNYWVNNFPGVHAHVYEMNTYGQPESGTSIMWTYLRVNLNDPLIVKFTNAVRSYDTFEFKRIQNIDAIKLNKYFSIIGMENFCEGYVTYLELAASERSGLYCLDKYTNIPEAMISLESNEFPLFTESENFILDSMLSVENEKIHRIVEGITNPMNFSTSIDGLNYIIFNIIPGINMSQLAAEYLIHHPEFDIFVWFDLNRKGLSFRTVKDNIDVSEIASMLGGGGHPKSAGAYLSDECFIDCEKSIKDAIIGYIAV